MHTFIKSLIRRPRWATNPPEAVSDSPLERYQRRVSSGEIRADRVQFATIRILTKLYNTILCERSKFSWLDRFSGRFRPNLGLYLWGGVGTGKTMLMDLFHSSLPEEVTHRIHYHRFMQSVHDANRKIGDQQNPLSIIADQLASHRILCLDEFVVTDITDAMLLSGLLHELFARNVTLVTTSNIHPDGLYRDGLQRDRFLPAIELLKKQTMIVKVDGGTDYRKTHLQVESLYHVPHNEQATQSLRQSFTRLEPDAKHNVASKNTISINDRKIDVVAVGSETVWFTFEALCNTNRSKVDYIELSKQFHTVVLSDVPLLTAEHEDSARRLVELIDELYDRGVNFIVSAEQPPMTLYVGTRLKQTFERTASRLQEMSASEYLSRPHVP